MNAQAFLIILSSSLLLEPSTALAQGGTADSPILQRDVTQTVLIADYAMDMQCRERKVVSTEVIEASPDRKTGAERWVLERCGKLVSYRVTFKPSPRGGTDFAVSFEK